MNSKKEQEYFKNKVKTFSIDNLETYTQDYFSSIIKDDAYDIFNTAFKDIDEDEIGIQFCAFSPETIDQFDKLVIKHKDNLTFDICLDFIVNVLFDINRFDYTDEEEYKVDMNDAINDAIDIIIGLFRYAIYCEQYEYAQIIEEVIDEIALGETVEKYEKIFNI